MYPREVEEALYEYPGVAGVAVIGIPDESLGEEVGAAVALKPGASATPGELRAFVRDRLAAYKYPRQVWLVEELPKGPTGKILRREVHPPAAGDTEVPAKSSEGGRAEGSDSRQASPSRLPREDPHGQRREADFYCLEQLLDDTRRDRSLIAMELARTDPSISTFMGVHSGLAMGFADYIVIWARDVGDVQVPETNRLQKTDSFRETAKSFCTVRMREAVGCGPSPA